MKKNQVFKNPPLMYIVQPNLTPITSNMQYSIFISKKDRLPDQENPNQIVEDSEIHLQSHFNQSNIPFHEMTINNRIKFLLNLPEQYQNVKCEITTKEKVYIGKMIEHQNDAVLVKEFSKPDEVVSLLVHDIENISIIDLNE